MIREILEDAREAEGDAALASFRPSLQRLVLDALDLIDGYEDEETGEHVAGLSGGFENRTELVYWMQRLAVRSLGEVPMFVYKGIAAQLASPHDRPVVQALLTESDMDSATAEHFRERVRKKVVLRGFDQAFRRLRIDATEYIDEADEGDRHNPREQRYIAMRPALDELDEWQRHALDVFLIDGFENREDIIDWAFILENATHGEPIVLPDRDDSTMPVGEFVDRCHTQDPMAKMLIDPEMQRVRETYAARFLIPTFNAGVRELLGTSGEMVDETETSSREGPTKG